MPLRHDSAAHGGPTPADPTYVCLYCGTPWAYARVQSLARCPDCGGPLEKAESPGEARPQLDADSGSSRSRGSKPRHSKTGRRG